MKPPPRRRSARFASFLFATACVTTAAAGSALALPPGRAWTPVDRYVVPGHTWFVSDWLNTDADGVPVVLGEAVGGIGQEVHALRWVDSLWTVTWAGGFPTSFSWPTLSPPGTQYLLWKGVQGYDTPTGIQVDLVMGQFFGDHIGDLDTLGLFYAGNWVYSAGVSSRRRWVAVSDRRNLRLLFSDTLREWNEVEVSGSGDQGVAVAPLDDSSALVAWAGLGEGLKWGVLRGTTWTEGSLLDAPNSLAGVPRFRRRPSGGHWLGWGTSADEHRNHLPMASFKDGTWSAPESLPCPGLTNGFWTENPDVSRDDGEYPAVVWVAVDATGTGRENLCVCMPTDSGFTAADHLPYTGLPTIARDRNGDVWVAWWDLFIGMFWLHTYNRATAEDVRIEGQGLHRRIAWTLSEPAPETWWAVLRARGDEAFTPVARVRAGSGLEMSWADSGPPAARVRYRIRRESVDARYRWESPEVRWPGKGRGLIARLLDWRPIGHDGILELENAAPGPLELRVFDVQGRMLHGVQRISSGAGPESIAFDLAAAGGRVRSGVYFVSIRDASGQVSPSLRLLVLR